DCGIAIHASKELTGTYDSSVSAAKQTGFPVEVIDSKMGAYALGKRIKNGIELEKNGESYEEIIDKIYSYTKKKEKYIILYNIKKQIYNTYKTQANITIN